MPDSPDVTPYVDLSLFDRDAQAIYEIAEGEFQTAFPDWTPREGHTEVALMEALALEVSELIFAINRLPGAITEVMLQLFGVERDEGAPATAVARIHASDTLGHVVPAGTRLRYRFAGDLDPSEFTTDDALTIASGSTYGDVAITATENGTRAHGVADGATLDVLDAIVFIESAEIETPPSGGREPESAVDFLDRGIQVARRLTSTLVLPDHFTAHALENPSVGRATTIDNFDPGVPDGQPGEHPGNVTVAVADENGAALSTAVKDALRVEMEDASLAALIVHVADPNITTVDVTATLVRHNDYTDADVQAAAVAALEAYLSPATWPWSATVRRNELIALLDGVDGVDYVDTLVAPAANVALTGVAPLADAGTLTITVNAPS